MGSLSELVRLQSKAWGPLSMNAVWLHPQAWSSKVRDWFYFQVTDKSLIQTPGLPVRWSLQLDGCWNPAIAKASLSRGALFWSTRPSWAQQPFLSAAKWAWYGVGSRASSKQENHRAGEENGGGTCFARNRPWFAPGTTYDFLSTARWWPLSRELRLAPEHCGLWPNPHPSKRDKASKAMRSRPSMQMGLCQIYQPLPLLCTPELPLGSKKLFLPPPPPPPCSLGCGGQGLTWHQGPRSSRGSPCLPPVSTGLPLPLRPGFSPELAR